jgi:hypothetical protein
VSSARRSTGWAALAVLRWTLPLLGILFSCTPGASGPEASPRCPIDHAKTPEELRDLLEELRSRTDVEAMICRARVYGRLREMEGARSPTLLAQGDAADVEALSHGAPRPQVAESSGRLAAHFRERAEHPELSRSSFPGHLGEPLRRIVLLTIAVYFGELAGPHELALSLEKLAAAGEDLVDREAITPEAARIWRERAGQAHVRAMEVRRGGAPAEPSPEAQAFCESGPGRHLEEGTRDADLGTREKANRGEAGGILQWYLLALAHYGVVRETLLTLTPAQEQALAAQDIVVRSLCDVICREP